MMKECGGTAIDSHNKSENKLYELIERCDFLKHCRDDAKNLSEPEWHKMICLLAHEYGGYEIIHEISNPYARYSKAETDEYIQKALKNNTGPVTCKTLKSLFDCGKNCAVTSPIHLFNGKRNISVEENDRSDDEDYYESDILKERIKDCDFPWDSLPDRLSECLNDLADDIAVQPEMCGVISLAIISTAIGNSVEYIEAKKGYKSSLNLWITVIADSGEKKTPVFSRLMKPIYAIQNNHYSQSNSNAQQTLKSIYTTDPTMEALIEMLHVNARGILLFQYEISGFIKSFDKYRNGKGGDREQYLNIWNSNPVKIDRVSKKVYVPKPFLTLLGGLQPNKMISVFKENSFDDGLISRFLFYKKDREFKELTDHVWSDANKQLWNDLIANIYSLQSNIKLSFDNDAWELFKQYVNRLDRIREHVPNQFSIFIPKAQVYTLRLAGILHIIESLIDNQNIIADVRKDTVYKAIKLTEFFLSQSRRIFELYGQKKVDITADQKAILNAIIQLYDQRKSFELPTAEIMNNYNQSVSTDVAINSSRSFGKLLVKELNNIKIDCNKKKSKVDGKIVQCLSITEETLEKMKSIIRE